MKIQKVKLNNINSLSGSWCIDFESVDFSGSSMYCITGPTGSGKTSILDAICLALYGLTPRQSKINAAVNEVMTYGALECSAEVTFECKGNVYSACWSQHRAAKTKKLQGYSWILVNKKSNESVTFSNQKEIEEKMKSLIGLDFDQFTKSMMLAQGEFNKFLKCNEDERAAILEKLTGDEIYRNIAKAVCKLYNNSFEAVERLKTQIGDNQPLSDEERKMLDDEISESEKKKVSLAEAIERLDGIVSWYATLHELESDVQKAAEAHATAIKANEEFKPRGASLDNALRAQEIEPEFATLCKKRNDMAECEKKLGEEKLRLPSATSALEQAIADREKKSGELESAKNAYAAGEEIWEKVNDLDTQIRNASGSAKSAKETYDNEQNAVESIRKEISDLSREIDANKASLNSANSYIESHSGDACIESMIPLLQSENRELKESEVEHVKASADWKRVQKSLAEFDSSLEEKKENFKKASEYVENHKVDAELVNVLPQAKSLVQGVEKNKNEIASLQRDVEEKKLSIEKCVESRKRGETKLSSQNAEKESLVQDKISVVVLELQETLREGVECPVCGSKDHPSCRHHEQAASAGIENLNSLADRLRVLNSEIEDTQNKLNKLDGKIESTNVEIADFNRKIEVEKSEMTKSLAELERILSPWKDGISQEGLTELLTELDERSVEFTQQKNTADALGKALDGAAVTRSGLQNDEANAKRRFDEIYGQIQKCMNLFNEKLKPWFSSITAKSIDAQLVELQSIDAKWKSTLEAKQKCENALASANSRNDELGKSLLDAESRLEKSKANLATAMEALQNLMQQREILFQDKVVDIERDNARNLRVLAEENLQGAMKAEQTAREERTAIESGVAKLDEILEKSRPELDAIEREFRARLSAKNFTDEETFTKSRLNEEKRQSLLQEKNTIEHALTAAVTSVKEASGRLESHKSKRNFEESEETAKTASERNRQESEELVRIYTEKTARRNNDDLARRKNAELNTQLDRLSEKLARWEQMQKWFNGNRLKNSTGNEFVRFIQVITLKNLLKTANSHLSDMFPRYELTVKEGSLDIMLIDHDNSDAIRPISNISGGEGFLVSLSLALGISTLASRNVRIDSMFLDEGFGTLDTKILQDTIVVLQKLQREKGKMLGVITHVDIVKDELKTHIDVIPKGGGRSILKGAGVS